MDFVAEIINFIESYIALSADEKDIIRDLNLIKEYKKDSIILHEGAYAKECYFVLKGCVRAYYVIEGEEKTTEFYTERHAITPISYATKKPSDYYLSCLEDCVLSLGTKNDILIKKIPRLESLIAKFNGEMLIDKQVSLDNFKNFSPEIRYQKLMESRPDLINRVPQYHLATYLGITPVSLSRMRKRISTKGSK